MKTMRNMQDGFGEQRHSPRVLESRSPWAPGKRERAGRHRQTDSLIWVPQARSACEGWRTGDVQLTGDTADSEKAGIWGLSHGGWPSDAVSLTFVFKLWVRFIPGVFHQPNIPLTSYPPASIFIFCGLFLFLYNHKSNWCSSGKSKGCRSMLSNVMLKSGLVAFAGFF